MVICKQSTDRLFDFTYEFVWVLNKFEVKGSFSSVPFLQYIRHKSSALASVSVVISIFYSHPCFFGFNSSLYTCSFVVGLCCFDVPCSLKYCTSFSERMADKTVDRGPWTGCAVMFLQSLCPGVNLLSLYKDQQGKFIVFKVIKLTLTGEHQYSILDHYHAHQDRCLIIDWSVFFMGRFCRRCWWLRDIKGPWRWSLPRGRGEVCGCGSMSAVPGELQLWSGASVFLPTRLPAIRPAPRAHSGNPAQGRHTHPGSVSGQAWCLPTACPPFTGISFIQPAILFTIDDFFIGNGKF